jgi:hypothetical protein
LRQRRENTLLTLFLRLLRVEFTNSTLYLKNNAFKYTLTPKVLRP